MNPKFEKPKDAIEECDPEAVVPRALSVRLVAYILSQSGMCSLLVCQALNDHATRIVRNEEQVLKGFEHSFINGPAYVAAAKDFLREFGDLLIPDEEPPHTAPSSDP